ncbi:MAG: hypothetical protein L6262_04615 [Weeksellaceae bacterium]|nr:hypothetical protein [Weeksellaceae bacterium]
MQVIRWGKQAGKLRFKYKNCGILFTRNRAEQKIKNHLSGSKNGYWKDTLQRRFYKIFEQSPTLKIIKREKVNVRMDATYFAQLLVAYQDDFDGSTPLIRFTD